MMSVFLFALILRLNTKLYCFLVLVFKLKSYSQAQGLVQTQTDGLSGKVGFNL